MARKPHRSHHNTPIGSTAETTPPSTSTWHSRPSANIGGEIIPNYTHYKAGGAGLSARQLHRTIGITYKSAWFMCHPIREALADPKSGPIGGEGKVIEADEAYHGKRKTKSESPRRKGRPFTETGGNQKRPIVAFMAATVDKASRLPTDGSARYPSLGTSFAGHETVVHAKHRVSRGRGDAAAEAQVWAKKLASSE